MCGIFFYMGKKYTKEELINYGNKIVHRGPDNTSHINVESNSGNNLDLFIMFHRLAINGLNEESNQPFIYDGIYLICNGEIFNIKNLIK